MLHIYLRDLHNINLTNVKFKLTYERNVLFHSLLNQERIHHAKIVFFPLIKSIDRGRKNSRCVLFSVACQGRRRGVGEERESSRRKAGGTVRANGRNVDVCYVRPRRSGRVQRLLLFPFHIVNLFVVRRIDSLSRLSFFLLPPSPPSSSFLCVVYGIVET